MPVQCSFHCYTTDNIINEIFNIEEDAKWNICPLWSTHAGFADPRLAPNYKSSKMVKEIETHFVFPFKITHSSNLLYSTKIIIELMTVMTTRFIFSYISATLKQGLL